MNLNNFAVLKLCKLAVNILNNFKLNQQKILAVLKLFKLAENNFNNLIQIQIKSAENS